ncbi:hypothetical protein [Ferrovum sp.]|uniref:hypothetical protein n=1 Tax=Ferrovum sp. TaxID=2609467 RepID=UPI00261CC423|nr:hypothetical protein [Ferrovum sp.]
MPDPGERDQASGLRRLISPQHCRILTVLGSRPGAGASLVVAGLARAGEGASSMLVLDEHLGPRHLGRILNLRLRYDARQVLEGHLDWARTLVSIGPQVDYLNLGRVKATPAAVPWSGLVALAHQRTHVLVDSASPGLAQRIRGLHENTRASVLWVIDEADSWTACQKRLSHSLHHSPTAVGGVINRATSWDRVLEWQGRCRTLVQSIGLEYRDFGFLPLAQRSPHGTQWRFDRKGGLPSVSLPQSLIRLRVQILSWDPGVQIQSTAQGNESNGFSWGEREARVAWGGR